MPPCQGLLLYYKGVLLYYSLLLFSQLRLLLLLLRVERVELGHQRCVVEGRGGLVLREHFASSRISKRDAGWVLSSAMGEGPSYAARAVMFAAAQATKRQRPTAIIHSRRRA